MINITPFTDDSVKIDSSLQLMTINEDDKNSFPPKYTPPANFTKDAYTLDISQNAFLLYGMSEFLENNNISISQTDMNQMISNVSTSISSLPSTLNTSDFSQFKTTINHAIQTNMISNQVPLESFNISNSTQANLQLSSSIIINTPTSAISNFDTYNNSGISSSEF